MKFLLLLIAGAAFGAQLSDVHSIYLMRMNGGLDQYLAGQLLADHSFRIVTDPKLADAVVTDHLGKGFEQELALLAPEPKEATDGKPAAHSDDTNGRPLVSSFGSGRGTVFIVGVRSHEVLWSVYQKPHGSSPADYERAARRIAKKLQDERP